MFSLFLRNPFSRIINPEDQDFIFYGCRNPNFSTFRSIFKGIRQEVGKDLLHQQNIRIPIQFISDLQMEFNLPLFD